MERSCFSHCPSSRCSLRARKTISSWRPSSLPQRSFLLGDSRKEIALGSIASALAVGTKFTAAYGLAILLAIVLVAGRPSAPATAHRKPVGRRSRGFVLVLGQCARDRAFPRRPVERAGAHCRHLHPPENLLSAFGTLVDSLDLSGARGADVLIYPLAGIVVAIALERSTGRLARRAAWSSQSWSAHFHFCFCSSASNSAALLLFGSTSPRPPEGLPGHRRLDDELAYDRERHRVVVRPCRPAPGDDDRHRRSLVRAPQINPARQPRRCTRSTWMFTLVALTLTYNPWLGRFFVFPVALSAALMGARTALERRGLGNAQHLPCVTLVLSLVHYAEKPSGLRLLDRSAPSASVWTMQRWQVQSQHDPAIGPVFRFLDQDVPRKSSIGLALGANDFGYPAFGPHLDSAGRTCPLRLQRSRTRHRLASGQPASVPRRSTLLLASESFGRTKRTVFRRAPAAAARPLPLPSPSWSLR